MVERTVNANNPHSSSIIPKTSLIYLHNSKSPHVNMSTLDLCVGKGIPQQFFQKLTNH